MPRKRRESTIKSAARKAAWSVYMSALQNRCGVLTLEKIFWTLQQWNRTARWLSTVPSAFPCFSRESSDFAYSLKSIRSLLSSSSPLSTAVYFVLVFLAAAYINPGNWIWIAPAACMGPYYWSVLLAPRGILWTIVSSTALLGPPCVDNLSVRGRDRAAVSSTFRGEARSWNSAEQPRYRIAPKPRSRSGFWHTVLSNSSR